jgi:S-formylglutathione hydrolase FrmB
MTADALNRRTFLKGTGGVAALGALGLPGCLTEDAPPLAEEEYNVGNGFGLTVTDQGVVEGRLNYYRFQTKEIAWQPAVNVLLPEGYHQNPSLRYPVMYLLHGGAQDFRKFHFEDDIINLTRGRKVIVVMPDGGTAGWYCNPKKALFGAKNWETFHIHQLLPWIDANFRTYAEYDGRAISGFSMGGFGALKYTAKYYGHFCSVSAHSGPPSMRRDLSAVLLWASVSAKFAELNGGTLYGEPFDQGLISLDNPVERIDSFGYSKRIFLVAGTAADVNETFVLNGQREFRGLLAQQGFGHEWYELPGAHFVRREMLQADIDGVIARCRKA